MKAESLPNGRSRLLRQESRGRRTQENNVLKQVSDARFLSAFILFYYDFFACVAEMAIALVCKTSALRGA